MFFFFNIQQLLQQQQSFNNNQHPDNKNYSNIQKELISSARILMDEMEMGIRFKFMAIFIGNEKIKIEKPVGFLANE